MERIIKITQKITGDTMGREKVNFMRSKMSKGQRIMREITRDLTLTGEAIGMRKGAQGIGAHAGNNQGTIRKKQGTGITVN